MSDSANPRRTLLERMVKSGLTVATGLLLAREAYWTLVGVFNVDEYEHLQVLWLIQRGLWPIRDYFHTHLPVYNFILYPIFASFGPRADLPGIVRIAFFPVVLLTVWQVWWIGRRVGKSSGAAWLTTTLFLASPWVGNNLVEMRPDLFGAPLTLAAAMGFIAYAESGGDRPGLMYLSGLAGGLSFLFVSQSALAMLATAGLFEAYNFHAAGLSGARRWGRMATFGALAVAPFGLAFAALKMAGLIGSGAMLSVFINSLNHANFEFFLPFRVKCIEVIGLSILPVFVVGALDSIGLRFWRWRDINSQNAAAKLVATIIPLEMAKVLLASFLTAHFFTPLVVFLAPLAARRSWKPISLAWTVFMVVAALCFGQFDTRGLYKWRTGQVAMMKKIMSVAPADKPVLDSYGGSGAFHPIVGHYLYFRWQAIIDPSDSEAPLVVQTLHRRGFGAVVYDPGYTTRSPAFGRLIRKNYVQSEYSDVFFLKEETP